MQAPGGKSDDMIIRDTRDDVDVAGTNQVGATITSWLLTVGLYQ